ncbi:nuclear envelope protein [Aspergillus arachidicola]|uniref:Nuclear envelope protein n=1 Tax=Aspergillus arachidicola TaxID=656916 RepID=A0A2G7G662_9EURO|nr:nuclear envelope protein [Aspergillus arachidicola]
MAAIRPRPYRRILTSALHRRFVHASALALLVCYLVAFLIGDKSSFLWAWFPIGACGIRTVLLFICSLVVFVLRVGQIHIGSRTTASPLGTLKYLIPLDVVQTFGWYIFSAWWFSEIYKWSSSSGAHLEWVNRGRPHERASLNERPIYLYTCHLLLAIVQSVVHLYYDFDRVPIPVAKRAAGNADQRTHPVESVSKRIQIALPCGVYLLPKRPAWSFTMYWVKLFWDFPRSAAAPPGLIGPIGPGLLLRTMCSGGLLVLCWQTANLFFSSFLSKEPLKRGQPLTAEAKDPNGSLLTGLTAKKETVKSFAFWELCFISQRFADRRKAIFNDIDRDGGPAWSQILQSATEVIKGISTRIDEQKNPSSGSKPAQAEQTEPVLRTLPRLTDPLKADNVFAPSPKANSRQEKIGEVFSSTAKSYGQSTDWTPAARAKARDVFDRASTAILSPERKQKLLASSQELKMLTGTSTCKPENLNPFIAQLLRSPVGRLFRQTYDRRLSGIVLGAPHANLCPIVDAIESLTRLLIASLQEDQYGKVQADVPDVVRLFTNTITTLEPFIHGGLDAHWTDVNFPPSSNPEAQAEARRVPDVDLVLDTLKSSLKDLLSAFNLYLKDIGLVGKDLRLAKEAAGLIEEGL